MRTREDYNNFYVKLDDERVNYLEEKGKIYTHGIGANGIGGSYIRLDHVISNMEDMVTRYYQNNHKIDDLFKDYNKNREEIEKLEKINDNLYKSYYNSAYAILTREEVEQIQKEIDYNFMSLSFMARLQDVLRCEKLGKVA